MTVGLCLDAGALIGIERGSRRLLILVERACGVGARVDVPTGVLAQVWRGGARQARLARFLNADGLGFPELDLLTARAVGEMCARTGAADVVDVHVALHARRHGQVVVTSDPDDFAAFAPNIPVVVV